MLQNSAAGLSKAARDRQNARARIGRAGAYPTRPAAKHGVGAFYHAGVVDQFMTCAGGARLVEELAQATTACLAAARTWHAGTALCGQQLDDNELLSRLWRAGTSAPKAPPWRSWGITQAPRAEGPCAAELQALCAAQARLHLASAVWCQTLQPLLKAQGLQWHDLLARAKCTDAELQARRSEFAQELADEADPGATSCATQQVAEQQGPSQAASSSGHHDVTPCTGRTCADDLEEEWDVPLEEIASGMAAAAGEPVGRLKLEQAYFEADGLGPDRLRVGLQVRLWSTHVPKWLAIVCE